MPNNIKAISISTLRKMSGKKTKVANSLEELLNAKDTEDIETKVLESSLDAEIEKTGNMNDEAAGRIVNDFFSGNSQSKFINEALYKTEIKEFICPQPITKIRITRKALSEMFLMAKAINEIAHETLGPNATELEIHCYCIGDNPAGPEKEPGIINGIFIPTQELSETSVKVSEDGIREAMLFIKQNNKRILGWSHSHGHFEVYSSETDDVNHETILNDTNNYIYVKNQSGVFRLKYAYGMTVVERGDFMGIVVSKNACGTMHMIQAEFDIIGPDYDDLEKAVILQQLKERIKKVVTVITGSNEQGQLDEEDMLKTLTEKFLNLFIRKLSLSRDLIMKSDEIKNDHEMLLVEKILNAYDELVISGSKDSFVSVAQLFLENVKKTLKSKN
jgi:hypothetical protein